MDYPLLVFSGYYAIIGMTKFFKNFGYNLIIAIMCTIAIFTIKSGFNALYLYILDSKYSRAY